MQYVNRDLSLANILLGPGSLQRQSLTRYSLAADATPTELCAFLSFFPSRFSLVFAVLSFLFRWFVLEPYRINHFNVFLLFLFLFLFLNRIFPRLIRLVVLPLRLSMAFEPRCASLSHSSSIFFRFDLNAESLPILSRGRYFSLPAHCSLTEYLPWTRCILCTIPLSFRAVRSGDGTLSSGRRRRRRHRRRRRCLPHPPPFSLLAFCARWWSRDSAIGHRKSALSPQRIAAPSPRKSARRRFSARGIRSSRKTREREHARQRASSCACVVFVVRLTAIQRPYNKFLFKKTKISPSFFFFSFLNLKQSAFQKKKRKTVGGTILKKTFALETNTRRREET